MYSQFLSHMTKKNDLHCPSGNPYTYHIFFFRSEPMSIWRIDETGNVNEFVELTGWNKKSDLMDYRSDIDSCVSSITAFYYELPVTILEMLERFPC